MITGASDGIGKAAAYALRQRHPQYRLLLVGRNRTKISAVAKELEADYFVANFESLGQVRHLAQDVISALDGDNLAGLANNAGGIFDGPLPTADGFERTWQVNVVAPFLLTSLLREHLHHATVVQTASVAQWLMSAFDPADPNTFANFSAERAYANAKLGTILLTRYLHSQGINSVAFHPGILSTGFARSTRGPLGKLYSSVFSRAFGSPSAGADNLIFYLLGQPGKDYIAGQYYNSRQRLGWQRPIAKNMTVARRIFDDLGRQLQVRW